MLRATAHNTPVQEVDGRWKVVRERPAPPPKAALHEPTPFDIARLVGRGLLAAIFAPTLMVWRRGAVTPQPPGIMEFLLPTFLLNFVGAILGLWGLAEIVFCLIAPRVTPTPKLLVQWAVAWRWVAGERPWRSATACGVL